MTWLSNEAERRTLDDLLALRPELQARYRAFYTSIWENGLVPRRVLELCRLRIAAIHDCESEWAERDPEVQLDDTELATLRRGELGPFDDAERAALVVAERIPFQHHELTDAEVANLKKHLGDAGCVSHLNALVLFDVNCRLKLTFGLGA